MERGRARAVGRGDRAKSEDSKDLEVAGKDGRDVHVSCRGSVAAGSSTKDFTGSRVCSSLSLEQGGRSVISYLEYIAYAQFLWNQQSCARVSASAYLCVAHLTEEGRSILI